MSQNNNDAAHSWSRRQFLVVAGAGIGAATVASCSGATGPVCAGPVVLSRSEQIARDGRQYVEASAVEGKDCSNCTFFQTSGGECGSCAIDALPANPGGYCTSWSAMSSAKNEHGAQTSHA